MCQEPASFCCCCSSSSLLGSLLKSAQMVWVSAKLIDRLSRYNQLQEKTIEKKGKMPPVKGYLTRYRSTNNATTKDLFAKEMNFHCPNFMISFQFHLVLDRGGGISALVFNMFAYAIGCCAIRMLCGFRDR